MGNVLSTSGLTKKYGTTLVNNNINISIYDGEIYALIGKNGAGKTTFMKIITGLSKPTSGTFSMWDGIQQKEFSYEYNCKVGALIENAGLMLNMTGYDNLKIKCICAGKNNPDYIWNLLKKVSLEKDGKKKVKQYSLGMKQRLGIALALVGDPDLLVLDEPTNGLDPEGIAFIRNLLLDLNKNGKTIIISSHILEELSKFSTRYGFISNGTFIEEISDQELKNRCMESGISIEEYYFNLIGHE